MGATLNAAWLVEQFATGLAAVIADRGGSAPDAAGEVLPAPPPPAAVPCLEWKQAFDGLPGEVYVRVSEPDTLTLGQMVLADSPPDDLRTAFRECLEQAFVAMAKALSSKLEREVVASAGQEIGEVPRELTWGLVRVRVSGQLLSFHLAMPPETLDALDPPASAIAAPDQASTEVVTRPSQNESRTFDLLLDVELPVSVSFGHAQVPLRDVLKLTTGSIVELDRAIVEPVDIVINNCVIAKGEVVVIEGNFGVRVQHVVSRSERLRTLQ